MRTAAIRRLAIWAAARYVPMGCHGNGRPWRVDLVDPRQPEKVAVSLDLCDWSVCTSGGYGTKFDATGRFHHLFDPSHWGKRASLHRGFRLRRERVCGGRAFDRLVRDAAGSRRNAGRLVSWCKRPCDTAWTVRCYTFPVASRTPTRHALSGKRAFSHPAPRCQRQPRGLSFWCVNSTIEIREEWKMGSWLSEREMRLVAGAENSSAATPIPSFRSFP